MKLSIFRQEKKFLSAEEAQNILKYGFRDVTLNEALFRQIESLESSIKSRSASGYRVLASVFQDYKKDLVDGLVNHFKEKGFTVDTYENPEIKGFIILIIGW